ncbi:actin-binding Rho-activating protein [Ambystoma mexicanum]|uniref:actin-binding Rho-activating protein n=1 Tax=Ambystoma mexicanum TaxID=8296 RepID=UPI0037E807B2
MPPVESQATKPAQRAFRKIRTACLVSSLARGWQQWATENTVKQAHEPSGWVPNEEKDPERASNPKQVKAEEILRPGAARLSAATKPDCRHPTNPEEDLVEKIKSKEVTKTIISKVQERGGDIGSLTERYEKDQSDAERFRDEKNLQDFGKMIEARLSPCRRRKCSNLVKQLTKGWKEIEQESGKPAGPAPPKGRSDSLETEDSGYGDGDAEDKCQGDAVRELNLQDQDTETAIRIKSPTASLATRTTDERKHMKQAQQKHSQVNSIKGKWQKWADHHITNQKLNPFSDEFDPELALSTRLRKGDEGYGRPKEGSKTAERARRAEAHIHREIDDMCFIISTMAEPGTNGMVQITFGELFDRYVRISDKVVGILMRARKHGLLHFEGEMLWQGRDDHVIITLLD